MVERVFRSTAVEAMLNQQRAHPTRGDAHAGRLREVVFGVVAGLSAAAHDVITIVTGMIALVVGFGLWWISFDVVGGRGRHGSGGRLGATGTVAAGVLLVVILTALWGCAVRGFLRAGAWGSAVR